MNAPEPKTTTLAALRKQEDAPDAARPPVKIGFFDAEGFALLQRGANLLANSTLVPKEYQGNVPNAVIALNMATRIGADPLMVMQNLYIVHGRPGWSSQFLIATFNQSGRFSALRYEWKGEEGKDDWGCRAWAIEKETGEKLLGTWITIKMAKAEGWESKSGSKWKTMPQQMLMYRAAGFFIRAVAPEIAMGLHTAEEIHDTFDAQAAPDGTYSVTIADEKEKAAAKPTKKKDAPAAEVADAEVVSEKPKAEQAQQPPQQAEQAKAEGGQAQVPFE